MRDVHSYPPPLAPAPPPPTSPPMHYSQIAHNIQQGNQRWQIPRPPHASEGYPRGSHEKYFKEIVSQFFYIRHLIVRLDVY